MMLLQRATSPRQQLSALLRACYSRVIERVRLIASRLRAFAQAAYRGTRRFFDYLGFCFGFASFYNILCRGFAVSPAYSDGLQIEIDDGYYNHVECASELFCFKLIACVNRLGYFFTTVIDECYFVPVHLILLCQGLVVPLANLVRLLVETFIPLKSLCDNVLAAIITAIPGHKIIGVVFESIHVGSHNAGDSSIQFHQVIFQVHLFLLFSFVLAQRLTMYIVPQYTHIVNSRLENSLKLAYFLTKNERFQGGFSSRQFTRLAAAQ